MTSHSAFVSFNKPLDQLISMKFKKQDTISFSVIENYLQISPAFVNKFNHLIEHTTLEHQEMKVFLGDYNQLKAQHDAEDNLKKKIEISQKIKKKSHEFQKYYKAKED